MPSAKPKTRRPGRQAQTPSHPKRSGRQFSHRELQMGRLYRYQFEQNHIERFLEENCAVGYGSVRCSDFFDRYHKWRIDQGINLEWGDVDKRALSISTGRYLKKAGVVRTRKSVTEGDKVYRKEYVYVGLSWKQS